MFEIFGAKTRSRDSSMQSASTEKTGKRSLSTFRLEINLRSALTRNNLEGDTQKQTLSLKTSSKFFQSIYQSEDVQEKIFNERLIQMLLKVPVNFRNRATL